MRIDRCVVAAALLASGLAPGLSVARAQTVQVSAPLETTPTPFGAADDPAIWVHSITPALSTVLGTDKDGGLQVCSLSGVEIQFLPVGNLNNVDVRYGMQLGGDPVDIAAATNRTDHSLDVWRISKATGQLTDIAAHALPVGFGDEVYGIGLYRSWITGKHYAIMNDKSGDVEQYELFDNGAGLIDATLVRSFSVGSLTEGVVIDDENGWLYIGEETVGIWRYFAEPNLGNDRISIDTTGGGGHLTADVEGLAIYHTPGGGGYLIASSQGSDEFVIYDRNPPNAYIKTFAIVDNVVDGCSATDGIDVTPVNLGAGFPSGMFVAHDDDNPGDDQNYKLVKWEDIANAGQPLVIDTGWDPRDFDLQPAPGDTNADGAVNIEDLLAVILAWGPVPDPCPPSPGVDTNGDCEINVEDLVAVILGWSG